MKIKLGVGLVLLGAAFSLSNASCGGDDDDDDDNGIATSPKPSCQDLPADCGPASQESCCANALVPGGSFKMGRSESSNDPDYYPPGNSDEIPEHDATIDSFYLDKYEVTVGRFRKFVAQYDGTPPTVLAGAHPKIDYSGWRTQWDSELPTSQDGLINGFKFCGDNATWTDTAGANEKYPMNCVSWYVAFAFCIWDGGRLPTEAEWEMAAAGGSENRLYPWGQITPDATHANFFDSDYSPFVAVGSHPAGVGRWGHYDLAGSMFEMVLDWYGPTWYHADSGNPCNNCAYVETGPTTRVARGGGWFKEAAELRATTRGAMAPSKGHNGIGIRCARDAP